MYGVVWLFCSLVLCSSALQQICVEKTGTNSPNCVKPGIYCCQTIQYALAMVDDSIDVVLSVTGAGRSGDQYTYTIDEPIEIKNHLSIIASTASKVSPILNSSLGTPLFVVSTDKTPTVPITFKIKGIYFNNTGIFDCQKTLCNVHISKCELHCDICKHVVKFSDISSSQINGSWTPSSSLTIISSHFQSPQYLVYSTNRLNINMNNVTINGNRIYMKNTNIEAKLTLRFQNISFIGVFSTYIVRLRNHYKLVEFTNITMTNVMMQQQAFRFQFLTNTKIPVEAFIRNLKLLNATNLGENLFDIERCRVLIDNVNVTNSSVTAFIRINRAVGNISRVMAISNNIRLLIVAQFSELDIVNVNVRHCKFEKVGLRDYRYGRYSPRTRKSLLFCDSSKVNFSKATIQYNTVLWNLVYNLESTLYIEHWSVTENLLSKSIIFNADNGILVAKNIKIARNSITGDIVHSFYAITTNITSMTFEKNFISELYRKAHFLNSDNSPIYLNQVKILQNTGIDIIYVRKSRLYMELSKIMANEMKSEIFNVLYADVRIAGILIAENFISKNSTIKGWTDKNLVAALESTFHFVDGQIIGNNFTKNFIHASGVILFEIANSSVMDNTFLVYGFVGYKSTYRVLNVTFTGNRLLSTFYLELCSIVIDGMESLGNQITSTTGSRFLLLDAFSSKNTTGRAFFYLSLRNVHVFDYNKYSGLSESSAIVLGAYFAGLIIENVTIELSKFQTSALEIFLDGLDYHFNRYKFQNINIICKTGSNSISHSNFQGTKSSYKLTCNSCPLQHYSLLRGSSFLNGTATGLSDGARDRFPLLKGPRTSRRIDAICKKCPVGGDCINGIVTSKPNYYGFQTSGNEIKFIQCPIEYCCSDEENQCSSYDSCNLHRHGPLCGTCDKGYRESFFSNKCVKRGQCKYQFLFWIVYTALALGTVIILCFMDNIKTVLLIIPKLLFKLLSRKENKNDGGSSQKSWYEVTKETVILGTVNGAFEPNPAEDSSRYQVASANLPGILTPATQTPISNSGDDCDKANRTQEPSNTTTPYTMQGVFNVLLSFYQMKSLIEVDTGKAMETSKFEYYIKQTTNVFNFEVFFNFNREDFCPLYALDAVSKLVVRYVLFNLLMAFLAVMFWCLAWFYNSIKKTQTGQSLSELLMLKLEICYLRIITFGYKNITNVSLVFITCVSINTNYVLYIDGTIKCLTQQQYYILAFIGVWVLPLPFSLYYSYNFYTDSLISFREMLLCLTIPPASIVYAAVGKRRSAKISHNNRQFQRIREMYEEPYRLLKESSNKYVFWEHWRLLQRLILSIVMSYLKDPLWKIYFSSPLVLIFLVIYLKVRPFKKELFMLHWLETASLIGICYQMLYNLLKGYSYLYNAPSNSTSINLLISFFVYTEFMFTPLSIFVLYLFYHSFIQRVVNKNLFVSRKKYKLPGGSQIG